MKQKRERKINYMIANNIRYLYNNHADVKNEEQIEVINKKTGEKTFEIVVIRPNSREGLMKKFGINSRTFNLIIKEKIFNTPPKFKELKGTKHLNQDEIDLICSSYKKMRDGFNAQIVIDVKKTKFDDAEHTYDEPIYGTQFVEPLNLKQKDLIATLNTNLKPVFGYELGYLKIYRVLVKNNIIIKKDKENNE
jgi:hypothetical protein